MVNFCGAKSRVCRHFYTHSPRWTLPLVCGLLLQHGLSWRKISPLFLLASTCTHQNGSNTLLCWNSSQSWSWKNTFSVRQTRLYLTKGETHKVKLGGYYPIKLLLEEIPHWLSWQWGSIEPAGMLGLATYRSVILGGSDHRSCWVGVTAPIHGAFTFLLRGCHPRPPALCSAPASGAEPHASTEPDTPACLVLFLEKKVRLAALRAKQEARPLRSVTTVLLSDSKAALVIKWEIGNHIYWKQGVLLTTSHHLTSFSIFPLWATFIWSQRPWILNCQINNSLLMLKTSLAVDFNHCVFCLQTAR